MTGSRSATARMAFRAIFRVARNGTDGVSAWSGRQRIAFRRPGCGKGAGPAFPSPLAGDG
jgi:hypothetical protein